MSVPEKSTKVSFILLCLVALFGIITFALAAATLSAVNRKQNFIIWTTTTTTPNVVKFDSVLAKTIHIDDLMNHLRQLQRIADESNGTRAINTRGFNETVNYIEKYLREQVPSLKVMRQTVPIRNFVLAAEPSLSSLINPLPPEGVPE